MNAPGHLERLALRSTRPGSGLRPRPVSVFEQSGGLGVVAVESTALAPASSRQEPGPDPVSLDRPTPRQVVADPLGKREEPSVPGPPARMHPVEPTPPSPLVPRAPPPAAGGEPHSPPDRVEPQPWLRSGGPEIAGRAHAETATSSAHHQPASPEAGETPVTASPVRHSKPDSPRLPPPCPTAPRPTAAPLDPKTLPRLHPRPTVDPPTPAPAVTVTIGRIEVLPPAPPKPPPPRAKPRAVATAPTLGDYLRERNER